MRYSPFVIFCWFGSACAALAPPQKTAIAPAPVAEADEPADEGEETGVKAIHNYVRQANRAIEVKQFVDATRLVRRAERAVQRASDLTRSHPEFEDTAEMVDRVRKRLDQAVEQDRLLRRQQAIAELTRQGNDALSRGNNLTLQLQHRVGTDEDVTALKEILGVLTDLKDKSVEYLDDPEFKSHVTARNQQSELLRVLARRTEWQVKVGAKIAKPIEVGLRAEKAATKALVANEKLENYRNATTAFLECANAVAELESAPEYGAEVMVDTPIGPAALDKVKAGCTKRGLQMRSHADTLEWQDRMYNLATEVGKALAAAHTAAETDQAVTAAEATRDTLASCETTVTQLGTSPGADVAREFVVATIGSLKAAELADACGREAKKITQQLPILGWRVMARSVGHELDAAMVAMSKANTLPTGRERVTANLNVIDQLTAICVRAQGLIRAPGAEPGYKVVTATGAIPAKDLEGACRAQVKSSGVNLSKAKDESSIEAFLAGCRADEVVVGRREGIPTRIENAPEGRTFIYERRAGAKSERAQRFDFDRDGKQADFWRRAFEGVRDRVNEAQANRQTAASASSAAKQVELLGASMGGVQECLDRLPPLLKSPQAQPGLKIHSVFGEVNASDLINNCRQLSSALAPLLAAAQQTQKLDEFVATCRADEVEVARREGIPGRIEPGDNGRVFVYGPTHGGKKKGSERRFAFDNRGKRVNEQALKKGGKIPPNDLPLEEVPKARKR